MHRVSRILREKREKEKKDIKYILKERESSRKILMLHCLYRVLTRESSGFPILFQEVFLSHFLYQIHVAACTFTHVSVMGSSFLSPIPSKTLEKCKTECCDLNVVMLARRLLKICCRKNDFNANYMHIFISADNTFHL
jgi:hypothetical protein